MIAFGTGLVGMPFLIRLLTSKGVGQPIHEDVTQHAHKAGTPVMGGLMAGCAIPPVAALSLIGFWEFRHPGIYATAGSLNIAVVAATMAAGCAGLLWWNAAPAQIFMGETGSLAIGTGMAAVALALHVELLIPILGAVFLAEGASSFL